jgi:hypothetical protein
MLQDDRGDHEQTRVRHATGCRERRVVEKEGLRIKTDLSYDFGRKKIAQTPIAKGIGNISRHVRRVPPNGRVLRHPVGDH